MLTFLQTESPDLSTLTDALDTSGLELWDYLTAVIILVASLVLGRLAKVVIRRLVSRTDTDSFLADLIGRLVAYLVVAFGVIYALGSLGIAVTPLLGALGIVGIALAFALQDILENFVAGIILQMRRPFTAGDQIDSFGHEGTVLEVDARTVSVRTPDGETVLLPSAEVIKHAIVNHSQIGRRRTNLEVGVAYGTDLDLATRIALDAMHGVDRVLSLPEPEVLVESFGASSIDLVLRFWHEPSMADRWLTRDAVARAIDKAFAEHGVQIPFPQRVVHMSGGSD